MTPSLCDCGAPDCPLCGDSDLKRCGCCGLHHDYDECPRCADAIDEEVARWDVHERFLPTRGKSASSLW